jgi:uncharacterized protein YfbU (UPF0304 family)
MCSTTEIKLYAPDPNRIGLILINQYEILNRLNSGSYERQIKILRSGFDFETDDLFQQIDEVGLSKDACIEVIYVLAMFDHLLMSFEKLKDKQGLTEFDIKFRGFDSTGDSEVGNGPMQFI